MLDTVRTLGLMVAVSLRADPIRSIAAVITAAGQMATLPLRAIGLRQLTDAIVQTDSGAALVGVLLVVGFNSLYDVMAWASFNVRMRLRENTQLYLDTHLMGLTAGIPSVEHHERPAYLDKVELLRREREYLANPFNPISWSVASLVQAASVAVLLAGVHPLLVLLPLSGVPGAITSVRAEHQAIKLREELGEASRMQRHLLELASEAPAAKEVRIFGLAPVLLQRHRQLSGQMQARRAELATHNGLLAVVSWGLFAAAYAAAVGFAVLLANQGRASAGEVVLVLSLGAQLDRQLADMVFHLTWLAATHHAVSRLRWLRDYAGTAHARVKPLEPVPVPNTLQDGIRLQEVAFAYPETEAPVLSGVNLYLPAGSTVALVGENGAGKTTLVKLLCRFYEPTSGDILVDGVDLKRFEVAEWRQRLAAGFQDFARLELMARQSVGVGELRVADEDARVMAALKRASGSELLELFPNGLDQQLGRSFEGGMDLSLGQWQKVALGRAMMREDPLLLLLDEPTASLDAPTEHALFEHFARAARESAARSGTITLLVSHRFSTVRMADLILVVGDGRVVEAGSHAELAAAGGLYAELYNLQASGYR